MDSKELVDRVKSVARQVLANLPGEMRSDEAIMALLDAAIMIIQVGNPRLSVPQACDRIIKVLEECRRAEAS